MGCAFAVAAVIIRETPRTSESDMNLDRFWMELSPDGDGGMERSVHAVGSSTNAVQH